MHLCDCHSPLRDTANPNRRHQCERCGGVTAHGRRLSLQETSKLIGQAHSILDRLQTDLVYAHEAAYGLTSPPDHPGRTTGHSDPTGRATAGKRADSAQYAALAAQWVRTAVGWLLNADEAAGLALQATDPHRGPADHTPAPYHDTIPAGRPDLTQAHAARARRRERGDL